MLEDASFFDSGPGGIAQPLERAGLWQHARSSEGAPRCCAYNQSGERLLCAEVEAADFSAAALEDRMTALAPGSSLALWVIPFRGISPASVRTALDLLYLDANCVVLDAVESYPNSRVDPSSKPAATVLILPAGAIAASRTRSGDQLILAGADEVKRRLRAQLATAPTALEVAPIPEPPTATPDQQKPKQAKSWLQRLLDPDPPEPRQATREALPWIAAYFFTGAAPVAHAVRNISLTGLYLLTEERWSPGTILRITLTDRREPSVERSITVNAKVVRWANDGVGLQFLYTDGKGRGRKAHIEHGLDGVSKAQIVQFLERVRSDTH